MPLLAALELPGRGGTYADRLAQAEAAVASAVERGASLVALPEAYLPGYDHIRADAGPAARRWMAEVARRHAVTIAMGYLEGDKNLLGVTTPDGVHQAYQKRFPSPAEARVWRAGGAPGIVDTPVGRIGLLVCADVLHLDAWTPLRGVDAVVVAAAWPDYRGRRARTPVLLRPALGWLYAESNPYRADLLARAAVALGAPVVFANASGPWREEEGFSGGTCIYAADGRRVAEGPVAVAAVRRGPPGAPLMHPLRWAAFTRAYHWAARGRAFVSQTETVRDVEVGEQSG